MGTRSAQSGPRRLLCFVHLEKAAGSTLHALLQRNFRSYAVLTSFGWPAEPADVFTAAEAKSFLRWFPFTRGIGGHSVRGYLGYEYATGRPVDYVTFLREPTSRFISHFNHQRAHLGIDWTIEAFLAEERFHNVMTKKICGVADADEAKRVLSEQFAFVGLTESYDESLVLLRGLVDLGEIDIRYESENIASRPDYQSDVDDPQTLRSIRGANALDHEVYSFVVNELYPQQCVAYGPDLDSDVAQFLGANEGYRQPAWVVWASRAYRWLAYRNVEMRHRRRHHPNEEMRRRDWMAYRFRKLKRRLRSG